MRIHTSRLVAVTAAALLAAACSTGDAVSSISPPQDRAAHMGRSAGRAAPVSRDVESSQANIQAQPVRCDPHAPLVGQGVFGPAGGTLVVGSSQLIIPGGALRDTVTISGTLVGDSSSTIEFAPHGLVFRKSAILVLDGTACAMPGAGAASIVYLDSTGAVLETIAALYLPQWKIVGAPIDHFSGYAIAF